MSVKFLLSLCLVSLAASLLLSARVQAGVVTFDDLTVPPAGFENGSNLAGGFVSNGVNFNNSYDATFGAWSGWAYSNKTDTTTAGYLNQYSAIAGSGAGNSANYGVVYNFSEGDATVTFNQLVTVNSMAVTNTTYAYLTMRDGDPFTDKFGGLGGNDQDFFLLTIKGFNGGNLVGSQDFYLADYRFSNNSQDYIVSNWETLNLASLGVVDSLKFALTSSDNGPFGMNTPAYFAADSINITAVPEPSSILLLGGIGLLGVAKMRARKKARERASSC